MTPGRLGTASALQITRQEKPAPSVSVRVSVSMSLSLSMILCLSLFYLEQRPWPLLDFLLQLLAFCHIF